MMIKVTRGIAPGTRYYFDSNAANQVIDGACHIHCFTVLRNYDFIRLVEGSLQSFSVGETCFPRTSDGFQRSFRVVSICVRS